MKVDERFHCFACGADGDVIDFTAQLFGLSVKEAAEQLTVDFNIPYDRGHIGSESFQSSQVKARSSLIRRLKNYQNENYSVLCSYFHLLRQWKTEYAPMQEDEEWHPLFVEAMKNTDRVEYLLEELQGCSPDEAKEIIAFHKNEIGHYANRVREIHIHQKQIAHEHSR
jgi:DNA primase